jgi:tetratricopeptide (TPR) repeat protein
MPTHVKKNRIAVLAAVAAQVCLLAVAQNAPAPAAAPGPANAGGLAPAPAPAPANNQPPSNSSMLNENATEIDSSTSEALKSIFETKPEEGTAGKAAFDVGSAIADKIKAVDVLKTPGLDDPALRARFETYLSLKEVPQQRIDEYFGKIKQISDMLQQGPNQDIFGAWKILYSLSDYEDLDAGISKELAMRVENFWNTDRTKNGLEAANDQLRNDIEIANHNADLDAADLKYQQEQDMMKQVKGSNSNTTVNVSNATNTSLLSPDADPAAAEAAVMPGMSNSLQGKMEMTSEYLNLLESRFKIKLNEIKENKMDDQDRMDFGDYIKTLYSDHRYYHVILAADFYRALFNQGDYPDDLSNQAVSSGVDNGRTAANGAQQISKTLGVNNGALNAINQVSGMIGGSTTGGGASGSDQQQPLSIADEVTAADEINERVSQAIEVFRYKADKGEIASAADELQEAFVGNEFHPALQGLPRDEKEKVGDFLTKLDVLKNQLEARDFEQVDSQITAIQTMASDFDPTKPQALVNAIKLEARLRLGKARLLAQADNLNDAMKEFQTAADEWPGNPDLNTSANTFFKSENTVDQATGDFDRLEQDQNYRAIFDRKLEFAIAVKGDTTREQQLKDALEKVEKAEEAEEKANEMVMAGDVDGAWETIEIATKDWPDDVKLNKMLADLSERGADFVSALNKAQEAESKKELGYSLTWYVNAQGFYPASVIANDGIDRVSKLILSPAAIVTSPGGDSTSKE